MARPVGRERVSDTQFLEGASLICVLLQDFFVGLLFVVYGHKPRFGHSSFFALSFHHHYLIISLVDSDTSSLQVHCFIINHSFPIPTYSCYYKDTRTRAHTPVCERQNPELFIILYINKRNQNVILIHMLVGPRKIRGSAPELPREKSRKRKKKEYSFDSFRLI